MSKDITIPDETITSKIYLIREQKVMVDSDLAELYGVETKYLKRQVRRNTDRFPEDFMFELTKEEFTNWRSQIVTSNSSDKMGLRYAPYVFTEQGVAMLSSVLNSPKAIAVNIKIIRVFTKLREMLFNNKDLLLRMEKIERKLSSQNKNIELVFNYLDELIDKKDNPKPISKIGFKKSYKS